ncbi:hypothetical protein KAR91_21530 [Candidatus Pacearchaeota archaeon]|nr:hypothetical protein [Candidatus Pacearchaeota archaeon]
MTNDQVSEKAQSLVDGKRSVKINGMWAYSPTYLGRGCLESRSGGVGLAMPSIPIKEGQKEEYQIALRIIKEVERLKWAKEGK